MALNLNIPQLRFDVPGIGIVTVALGHAERAMAATPADATPHSIIKAVLAVSRVAPEGQAAIPETDQSPTSVSDEMIRQLAVEALDHAISKFLLALTDKEGAGDAEASPPEDRFLQRARQARSDSERMHASAKKFRDKVLDGASFGKFWKLNDQITSGSLEIQKSLAGLIDKRAIQNLTGSRQVLLDAMSQYETPSVARGILTRSPLADVEDALRSIDPLQQVKSSIDELLNVGRTASRELVDAPDADGEHPHAIIVPSRVELPDIDVPRQPDIEKIVADNVDKLSAALANVIANTEALCDLQAAANVRQEALINEIHRMQEATKGVQDAMHAENKALRETIRDLATSAAKSQSRSDRIFVALGLITLCLAIAQFGVQIWPASASPAKSPTAPASTVSADTAGTDKTAALPDSVQTNPPTAGEIVDSGAAGEAPAPAPPTPSSDESSQPQASSADSAPTSDSPSQEAPKTDSDRPPR